MWLHDVDGLLTANDLTKTVDYIASLQLPSGMVQWFDGGHADPWNHTEALMALATGGRVEDARRGFEWLRIIQRPDGSWHQYYLADSVEQDKLDANVIAYVAAGVWHHWLLTEDRQWLESMWDMVDRAIEFVIDLQTPRGEIIWARHADGTPWTFALLTGSSSMLHSIRSAIAIAEVLGQPRPDWELAAARLSNVIRNVPEAFAPKHRWAMDWYYPVLCGAITGDAARQRIEERYEAFVMDGCGVRCVSDRPWITAAETCEFVMSLLAIGDRERAEQVFSWAQRHRDDEGRYWTGIVYPDEAYFPGGEQSSYTAAAVVLGADALAAKSPVSHLFTDHDAFPPLIDLTVDEFSDEVADRSGE